MAYRAPVRDILFTLNHIVDLPALEGRFSDLGGGLADSILEEAGKFAAGVLAPLDRVGDAEGAHLDAGKVTTAAGFAEAWAHYVEGGWGSLPFNPVYGGQGLPRSLSLAVQEIWQGANLSLGLCPLLTSGAIELLSVHGSEAQKTAYLPKLISGAWTGTMNLTEPQAGSDVGALKARAVPRGDGTYAVTGTKIFITFGEHDMAENIIHLVLARLPDAPPGTRGISLFVVPKFLVNADGSLGARNDVVCTGLEEKLGIHASPTCVMTYGDKGGATGFLVGEENGGMKAMFTMMNNARLCVGLQAVGVSEAATQKALAYAQERQQGKPFGLQHALRDMVPIFAHEDVRRMLMTMKATTEAMRAICYATARAADDAATETDPDRRAAAHNRENLLTPIAKGWCTERGVEIASLGIQVHGGMGYVEETGAAKYFRDARILPIYEGTNGIQAIDLVTRKLGLAGGAAFDALCEEMQNETGALEATGDPALLKIAAHLAAGEAALAKCGRWLRTRLAEKPGDALAGAFPFLEMAGLVVGGALLAKGARAAAAGLKKQPGDAFLEGKVMLAQFFAEAHLSRAPGLSAGAQIGDEVLGRLRADHISL